MWIKKAFFIFLVRPLVLIISGVSLVGKENLPTKGPAVLIANHNSHLDTMVIMSLFSLKTLEKVRPIGAEDYFCNKPYKKWLSKNLIDLIALKRRPSKADGHPFGEIYKALDNGEIVLLFPEGSRGDPEVMKPFKTGIAHIAKDYPTVPVIPLSIYGAGRALPRGEALFVPFIMDVNVGEAVYYGGEDKFTYTHNLQKIVLNLEEVEV
ncbi:MAG: 1-acyl-sn-glycerol-3-phosphate acyltransferase (EC [uncultured Sulfurovum sp.]|uniref:1-acyl-sn-glycerol-3-phosphate acyltransferase (EC) n=1 Tax=uncultured Sulfurovum sp. TaxID=269237 RepID=A0A6S6SAG3_9BACT|nr:MAG: 1-acyl-sn-glycerol-3-phosphate acyltransferase (EC [uncultured Sulfurovum sp.]